MCITVGNVSLEDCDLFTWSFGCTNFSPDLRPRISAALLAITSLAFILD
uniref:Fumarate hydratase 1 n=1 Tax=Rhizophora mucronata TaxID=61149 RepID=A0A2P2MCV8_RHIMU